MIGYEEYTDFVSTFHSLDTVAQTEERVELLANADRQTLTTAVRFAISPVDSLQARLAHAALWELGRRAA